MSDPHRSAQAPRPEHHQRSGETEWIPRVSGGPRRDEPFGFREEPPEPPSTNPALVWAMRIAGLVAIAVISGLVWTYISNENGTTPTAPPTSKTVPDGRYQFAAHEKVAKPKHDTDCVAHSYGKMQTEFFKTKPCEWLERGLYVATVEGKKTYSGVSVVRMPSAEHAQSLYDFANQSNTGNVADLIRGGVVAEAGLAKNVGLSGGGYEAVLRGQHVIIVESDYVPQAKRDATQKQALSEVSKDAIRFGESIIAEKA